MSTTYENLLREIDLSAPRFEDEKHGTIVTYHPNARGNFTAVVIESFKSKKLRVKTANTVEQIKAYFERLVEFEEHRENSRQEYARTRKAQKERFLSALRPGVILYDSWGYEQTNVEFYIVREVNGNKVKIQELGHKSEYREGYSSMSSHVMPDLEKPIGEVIEKTVMGGRIKICSSISLGLWDGTPKYCSWYA